MTTALVANKSDWALTGPVGSLDAYLQSIHQIPVLSAEEENTLALRFRDEQDLEAARQLVLSHLRFVVHIARGYNGYGLQLGDLIQEGNIGLMKAVKRFDPDYGVRLVSFAVHWIRAEMHEFILRNWRVVKVATTKAQRKLFFNLRKAKKNLGWLSAEETDAVARDLGVKPETVTQMEQRLYARDMAFDPQPANDEEGREFNPAAFLQGPDADPAAAVEEADWQDDSQRRLAGALGDLDERSRDIVASRWLGETKKTLNELASDYGVSAERIRQIEAAAIKKMRSALSPA